MLANFFEARFSTKKNIDKVCDPKKHADLAITVTVLDEGLL